MDQNTVAPIVSQTLTFFGVQTSPFLVQCLAIVALAVIAILGRLVAKLQENGNKQLTELLNTNLALQSVIRGVEATTPSKGETRQKIADIAKGFAIGPFLDAIVQRTVNNPLPEENNA